MSALSRADLEELGFHGFESVRQLVASRVSSVPCTSGVYAVLREAATPPRFRRVSKGGRFNCKDPTIPVAVARANWVAGASIVYLGRAQGGRRHLHARIGQLLAFGSGLPVDHWGGRLIWQLADSTNLTVCWKPATDAAVLEKQLLRRFHRVYGSLPFANLRW